MSWAGLLAPQKGTCRARGMGDWMNTNGGGRLGQKETKGSGGRPKCRSTLPLPLVALPPMQPTRHSLPLSLCARGRVEQRHQWGQECSLAACRWWLGSDMPTWEADMAYTLRQSPQSSLIAACEWEGAGGCNCKGVVRRLIEMETNQCTVLLF